MTSVPVSDTGPHDLSGVPLASHLRPYLESFATPPRVLIIGNYGRGNLGDEAILSGILAGIRDVSRPAVLSRDPDRVHDLHDVDAVQSLSVAAVRTALRSDVIAVGGGGIFGNGMTLLPRLLPLAALLLQLLGKQIVFVAIGAYATAPRWVSRLLRLIARRSPLVAVRDPESAATFGARAVIVRDPGIDLPPAPEPEARALLALAGVDPDAALLGVSVKPAMDPAYDDRQHEVVVAAVNWWLTYTSGEVVFFVMSARGDFGLGLAVSDRTLADRITASCVAPERVSTIGPDMHPSMMKAVVGAADVVLAHRLHAQIFAWSMGVGLVGMSYERKSDEFLRVVDVPRIALAVPDPGDGARWLQALVRAAPDRASRLEVAPVGDRSGEER